MHENIRSVRKKNLCEWPVEQVGQAREPAQSAMLRSFGIQPNTVEMRNSGDPPCPPPPPLPSDPSSQSTLPCFPPHLACHVGVPVIDVAGPMRPHVHRTLPRCAQGAPRARRERRRAAAAAASAQDVPGVRGHESRVAHVRSFFGSRGRSCVRCARPRRGSWSFALRCTQWCARAAVRRRRWPSSS